MRKHLETIKHDWNMWDTPDKIMIVIMKLLVVVMAVLIIWLISALCCYCITGNEFVLGFDFSEQATSTSDNSSLIGAICGAVVSISNLALMIFMIKN